MCLRNSLKKYIGFPFKVYRLWDQEDFSDWYHSGYSINVATSLSKDVATSFLKFAKHSHRPQVLVELIIDSPDAIVMRGKLSELELVIDLGWVQTTECNVI